MKTVFKYAALRGEHVIALAVTKRGAEYYRREMDGTHVEEYRPGCGRIATRWRAAVWLGILRPSNRTGCRCQITATHYDAARKAWVVSDGEA